MNTRTRRRSDPLRLLMLAKAAGSMWLTAVERECAECGGKWHARCAAVWRATGRSVRWDAGTPLLPGAALLELDARRCPRCHQNERTLVQRLEDRRWNPAVPGAEWCEWVGVRGEWVVRPILLDPAGPRRGRYWGRVEMERGLYAMTAMATVPLLRVLDRRVRYGGRKGRRALLRLREELRRRLDGRVAVTDRALRLVDRKGGRDGRRE